MSRYATIIWDNEQVETFFFEGEKEKEAFLLGLKVSKGRAFRSLNEQTMRQIGQDLKRGAEQGESVQVVGQMIANTHKIDIAFCEKMAQSYQENEWAEEATPGQASNWTISYFLKLKFRA